MSINLRAKKSYPQKNSRKKYLLEQSLRIHDFFIKIAGFHSAKGNVYAQTIVINKYNPRK
jgi:hypothetical protein